MFTLKSKMNYGFVLLCFSLLYCNSSVAFDSSQCFLGYAKMGGNNLDNHLKQCLTSIKGESLDGTSNNIILSLQQDAKNKPQATHLLNISKKAQEAYYDDSICGQNISVTPVTCHRIRQLSQLHPSGMYRFNCPLYAATHARCPDFSLGIVEKLDGLCDKSHVYKNQCTEMISAFLAHPKCNSSVTERACLAYFSERLKNADGCDIPNNNFDANGCAGTNQDMNVATISPDDNSDPSVGDFSDSEGDGGGSAVDPTTGSDVTSADGETLGQVANQLGQNMFGGGMGMGMMNQPPSPSNVPKSDPGSSVNAGSFEGPNGLNEGRMVGTPQGTVHLPLAANLPIPTEGRPGPREKNGAAPSSSAGGGNGGMMGGGGGMGNPGMGGGAAAGAGRGGRSGGGYRGSAWKKIADALGGNNYMGTDGAPAGAKAEPPTSSLPKALRKKIAQNNEAEKARAQVNAMFRKNLPTGTGNGQIYSPFQFPSVNKAYDSVYQDQNYYRDSN